MATRKNNNRSKAQLVLFNTDISVKRFTIERMLVAKLDRLSMHIDKLTHSDVVWLSRIEEFFQRNEYLTERQSAVLDSIIERQKLKACL